MTHPCKSFSCGRADPPDVAQEVSANLKSFLDFMKLVKVVLSNIIASTTFEVLFTEETRSSWLNCALRDDEAVYWVSLSIGHYEAVAVCD